MNTDLLQSHRQLPSQPSNQTVTPTQPKMHYTTHTEELEFLKKQGFTINPFNTYADTLEEVWKISTILEKQRKKLQYGIDGMVVKVNNLTDVAAAGVVGKTPRAHCAIKFAAEESTTTLTNLVWQVGRTGKITPVAEFAPTQLAGSTVRRATLHNYKEFVENQLHQNDTLVIRKAGDIIPEVVSILTHLRQDNSILFTAPAQCPECGTTVTLSKSGVDLECPNQNSCKAQIIGRLSYFAQRSVANIKGLSEKQIEKFIDLYGISDIYDLYTLPFADIKNLEGFGEQSVTNLQNSINQASTIRDKKFLAGLSIEGVGSEVAQLIITKLYEKQNTQTQSINPDNSTPL